MLAVAPPLRVVIYRRLMMRIAEAIARGVPGARMLVTGEVVGQVASQTLENMTSINEVVTQPVLRPLIGMDKEEITAEAQRPRHVSRSRSSRTRTAARCSRRRHPATKARRGDVVRAEAALPIDEIVDQAVAAAVVEHFQFPVIK